MPGRVAGSKHDRGSSSRYYRCPPGRVLWHSWRQPQPLTTPGVLDLDHAKRLDKAFGAPSAGRVGATRRRYFATCFPHAIGAILADNQIPQSVLQLYVAIDIRSAIVK